MSDNIIFNILKNPRIPQDDTCSVNLGVATDEAGRDGEGTGGRNVISVNILVKDSMSFYFCFDS